MNKVEVISFPSGPFETNAYLVISSKDGVKSCAIIDPAPSSKNLIIPYLVDNKINPEKIILTHSHWDHFADAKFLVSYYKIPLFVHEEDAYNLKTPGADRLPTLIKIEGVEPTGILHDGDFIEIGETSWKVIHTPGHSPGSICLYCEEEQILLSGDTIFQGTIGNLSFPTGEPERMWVSLQKLSILPQETLVFPGHGPSTTIKEEKWLPNAKKYFGRSI